MRYQNVKKVLALCLALCLTLGAAPTVFAAQPADIETITPYALYIKSKSCQLTILGKTAAIDAYVVGQSGSATKCKVVASLQRKTTSGSWSTVQSWTDQQDGRRASVSETATVTSGTTYRVTATVTVWAGSETETMTVYSDPVTA